MNTFLTAEWRKLLMMNYTVHPEVLDRYVPPGTELDYFQGRCYISLVGFMFLNTRVLGIPVPFHRDFEEVNLRFYVKYNDHGEWKRGVVFIKEIVPRHAITFVANALYGEKYETMPMGHSWTTAKDSFTVRYMWKKQKWHHTEVVTDLKSEVLQPGGEAEFITQHFWGYTGIGDHVTSEYEVEHPPWEIYPVRSSCTEVDFGVVYGEAFEFLNRQKPVSVFLAEGSSIAVKRGIKLPKR